MAARHPYYPVSLAVEGRPCLVVGGGPVATRKAGDLAACGAAVTMVAPRFCAGAETLAREAGTDPDGSVSLVARRYEAGEVANYRLVVTATGIADVDGAVAADADAAGVWVNSADDPANCSFIVPSVHRDGAVSVAISTGGTSPALAVWLRRRAADALGPDLGALAELMGEARRAVAAEGRSTEAVDWRSLLDGPLVDLVRQGRLDEARALLAAATAP